MKKPARIFSQIRLLHATTLVRMTAPRRLLCCFLLFLAPLASAGTATNPKDIAKSLKGKTVFLRGMEAGDNLSFDAQRAELGSYQTGSFAYSAIRVDKVHFSDAQLTIEGRREASISTKQSDTPSVTDLQFVPLDGKVQIIIGIDAAHPEAINGSIGKVFAFSASDALGGMPNNVRRVALYSIGAAAPPIAKITTPFSAKGGGVMPPRLLHSVVPEFTKEAKAKKDSGLCVVKMIVDTTGHPAHIRIVHSVAQMDVHSLAQAIENRRPLDYGLQVNAVKAVSQYRFAPAQYGGIAVPVVIDVEVNFRIY